MKNLHSRFEVVKARIGWLNNEAGAASDLLGRFAGAGWPVDYKKVEAGSLFKRLFSRGKVLHPNTRLNPGGKPPALPCNASPLLNIEVGDFDAPARLGRFSGNAARQRAFTNPALLGNESDNFSRLLRRVFHKKLSPDNSEQKEARGSCLQLPTVIYRLQLTKDYSYQFLGDPSKRRFSASENARSASLG